MSPGNVASDMRYNAFRRKRRLNPTGISFGNYSTACEGQHMRVLLPRDEIDLLQRFLDGLPTEEAEREEFLLKAARWGHELAGLSDPRLDELNLRWTCDILFDLHR